METLKRSALCLISLVILLGCKKSPVAIIDDNKPPFARAGADQTLILPQNSTQLVGSGTDPDGSIISYQWFNYNESPGSFYIETAKEPATTLSYIERGRYFFTFKVTDNEGKSSTDRVLITVLDSLNDPCNGCWDY